MENNMPSKPPPTYPAEQRVLSAFGERLRLARRRRKLTSITIAERAGIARTTLYKAESGDPGVTLGTYVRIMAALGMDKDFEHLAADDKVGRTLQDLALTPTSKRKSATPTASRT